MLIIQVHQWEWKLQVNKYITIRIKNILFIGVIAIFRRSENKHLLRYTTFIADGDAANERALSDTQPYGPDTNIRRLQCIGHFSKR